MVGVVYIAKEKIAAALAVPPVQGKRNLEPFKTLAKEEGLPFSLLEDAHVSDNEAEVHLHEDDVWLSLEGECTFVCGGTLVDERIKINRDGSQNQNELRGSAIKDGTTYTLRPGDWLWIPASIPHQHNAAGVARLAIIKIPAQR